MGRKKMRRLREIQDDMEVRGQIWELFYYGRLVVIK